MPWPPSAVWLGVLLAWTALLVGGVYESTQPPVLVLGACAYLGVAGHRVPSVAGQVLDVGLLALAAWPCLQLAIGSTQDVAATVLTSLWWSGVLLAFWAARRTDPARVVPAVAVVAVAVLLAHWILPRTPDALYGMWYPLHGGYSWGQPFIARNDLGAWCAIAATLCAAWSHRAGAWWATALAIALALTVASLGGRMPLFAVLVGAMWAWWPWRPAALVALSAGAAFWLYQMADRALASYWMWESELPRTVIWRGALDALPAATLGWGLGAGPVLWFRLPNGALDAEVHAHSVPLQLLLEGGGLFVWIGLFVGLAGLWALAEARAGRIAAALLVALLCSLTDTAVLRPACAVLVAVVAGVACRQALEG